MSCEDCSGPLCLQVEALLLPWDLHGLACRRQLSKLGQWSTTYLNELPEVQDMVNDVDIDGDGQRMCFCQVAWQWFLWHLVVKPLGGRVHSWWCRHDVVGTVQGI